MSIQRREIDVVDNSRQSDLLSLLSLDPRVSSDCVPASSSLALSELRSDEFSSGCKCDLWPVTPALNIVRFSNVGWNTF